LELQERKQQQQPKQMSDQYYFMPPILNNRIKNQVNQLTATTAKTMTLNIFVD
jgi:hypothetical protein